MLNLLLIFIMIDTINAFTMNKVMNRNPFITNSRLLESKIKNLEADEFQGIVDSTNSNEYPIVIDFQKSKCGPCMKIAPDLEKMADKYAGKVDFFKVDADKSKEALKLMKTQGIRAVPTFHIWFKGEKIDTISGARIDELDQSLFGTLSANKLLD